MRGSALVAAVAAALVAVAAAPAHDILGRAQPRIDQTFVGTGAARQVQLRIRDSDSLNPIPTLDVVVTATKVGGGGSVTLPVVRRSVEIFRVGLGVPSAGTWSIRVAVAGDKVAPAFFSLDVPIAPDEVVSRPAASSVPTGAAAGVAAGAAAALAAVFAFRRRRPGAGARPAGSSR